MKPNWKISIFTLLTLFTLIIPTVVMAQDTTPTEAPTTQPQELTLSTPYPSQVIGLGETASLPLKLHSAPAAQTAQLSMKEVPEGWTASFRGAGDLVNAVYVEAGGDAAVDLRLEQPADAAAGTYRFVVSAQGDKNSAELTIDLTIQEKVPPKLTMSTELTTLRGAPTTTFRYNVELKNEGGEDLTVNLVSEAPNGFVISFEYTGQDVTSLPLGANETKRITVSLQPIADVAAGSYPFTVRALGGEVEASLDLTAEVSGQSELSITAPDGRLSGQAYAGKETPLQILLVNNGTAPALGIELSASAPSGWTVTFDPTQITEIPAGQQVEATANIRPADQAVAGDYVVTIRANVSEGQAKSSDFRITVLTSTLWGLVGIAFIAAAVVVVALAVGRYGRR